MMSPDRSSSFSFGVGFASLIGDAVSAGDESPSPAPSGETSRRRVPSRVSSAGSGSWPFCFARFREGKDHKGNSPCGVLTRTETTSLFDLCELPTGYSHSDGGVWGLLFRTRN